VTRASNICIVLFVLIASCQVESDDEIRTMFVEEVFSLVTPAGWDVRRDRGTIVLVEKAGLAYREGTIAIRSVPVTGCSEVRTRRNVLPSTEKVLRALPGATMIGPNEVEHSRYPAVAYNVVFTPQGQRGENLHRRHIVLFSPERVIHVLHTGSKDEIDRGRAVFDRVIESIREEG
jgi:hypothetical protein